MPDFNLDSESLRAEFAKIITFWQSHGVGGFRLDARDQLLHGCKRLHR